jgi:hypothetical protein
MPHFCQTSCNFWTGNTPNVQKLVRAIGMFFHYNYYLQSPSFNNDYFCEPQIQLSDATGKGEFLKI